MEHLGEKGLKFELLRTWGKKNLVKKTRREYGSPSSLVYYIAKCEALKDKLYLIVRVQPESSGP